jgi:hypothetical protein
MVQTTQQRIPVALAVASIAVLAAGCGGGTTPPQAGGGGPPKNIVSAAYRFSRCMRQHGVPSFPDPIVHSSPGHQEVGVRVTPTQSGSPRFATAQKACAGIMPGPGNGNASGSPQELKGKLAFASCMRSHHVPAFPDPTTQGRLTLEMLKAAGIDLRAPAVQAAATACVSASQGAVTAAQVASALHGGH